MKKLFALSFLTMFAACKSHPDTADTGDVRFDCMKNVTECTNDCHHVGGTNSEEYNCTENCKITARKCVASKQ